MRKLELSILMVGVLFLLATSVKAQQNVEGAVTAISEIGVFTPVTDLSFDSEGAATTVASITVSNNYENAWDLKLAFTNDGQFKRVSADGDASAATGVGAEIDITAFSLEANEAGTLGTGLTAPTGAFTLTEDASHDFYTFDNAATQTTATVGYVMDIKCSWDANSEDLQGTYQETITATLTVGDGS
jgi:hypothetical protein